MARDVGIQTYLKQISDAPLLSAEEERALAEAIQKAKSLNENPPADLAGWMAKEQVDRQAVEAREKLVRCNLRLVVNIAKRFARRGMPLQDLIEEGNLGLIRAVEGFDPNQNTRFSTYASWWIKQAIKRSLINSRQAVHIPAYMVEMISKWKQARTAFVEKEGRQPTVEELAQFMDLPEKKVQMIRHAVSAFTSSQQAPGDGDDMSLAETLTDNRTPPPDEIILTSLESNLLQRLLGEIEEREATILRLRFGLDDAEPMTLKDIGAKIGLTRERVRQIQDEALRKLEALLEPD